VERTTVVTDSVATVPETLCRDLGILVVPLTIELDGVVYRDGVDLAPDDFYARMRTSKLPPRTSQPSLGAWLEKFNEAAAEADRILCLTLSAKLSGTYSSAVQAATIYSEESPPGRFRPPLHVIDTGLGTVAEGWVVIEAARAARSGAPFEDVLARARAVMARAKILVAVDTMEYLARSGHVPRLVASTTGLLGLKPLIKFRDGDAVSAGVAASVEHAYDVMLRRLSEERRRVESEARRRARLHVGVMHAGAPVRGAELAELVRRLEPDELLMTGFTPVMGAHAGPGLFGVGYFAE